MVSNFHVARGGRASTPKQKGFRAVRHLGGRLFQTESSGKALAAGPILVGESLVAADLFCQVVTDSDIQPDSAVPYEFVFFVKHGLDLSGSSPWAGTSAVDTELTQVYEQNTNIGAWEYNVGASLGAGDEPGYADAAGFSLGQREVVYNRTGYLSFLGSSGGGWNGVGLTTDSHNGDVWRKTFKRNLYFPEGGYWIMGIYKPNADAETAEFGVEDFYPTPATIQDAVSSDPADWADMDAQTSRFIELLYGGDKYVEADTWKEDDFRALIAAQLRFRTPFPRTVHTT